MAVGGACTATSTLIRSPLGEVRTTTFYLHCIEAWCSFIQSIPRIKSMPDDLSTIGLALKSTPLKEILSEGQKYDAGIPPPVNLLSFDSSWQLLECYDSLQMHVK